MSWSPDQRDIRNRINSTYGFLLDAINDLYGAVSESLEDAMVDGAPQFEIDRLAMRLGTVRMLAYNTYLMSTFMHEEILARHW